MIQQPSTRNNLAASVPSAIPELTAWESSFFMRPALMELIEKWNMHDAVETYGVRHWGKGYFGVNQAGHVTVHPNKNPEQAIDLKNLIDQLQARGIQLPILLRFTDIVLHRVGEIHEAYQTAIREYDFQGK